MVYCCYEATALGCKLAATASGQLQCLQCGVCNLLALARWGFMCSPLLIAIKIDRMPTSLLQLHY